MIIAKEILDKLNKYGYWIMIMPEKDHLAVSILDCVSAPAPVKAYVIKPHEDLTVRLKEIVDEELR